MPPRRAAGLRDSPAANGESLPAEAFASAVRDALAKLAEPSQLQRHPLTRLLSSEQGPGVKPAQAGQALAHSLSEAIERQRPSPGTVERSRAWRRYHILRLRYLEGHDSVEVQRQLALGKSQYYLDRNHAVQAVIASLAEQWHVAVDPPPPTLPENDAKTEAPPGYLPAPVTSFVGREREVTALRRLLTAGAQPAGTGAFHPRLVTVTGPAGTGKTRLVIEVAAALGGAFADGVHLAPLALIGDPGLVLPAIGRAFGIPEAGARPMAERLAQAVRHRQALLVLDNFEQVLPAALGVAELLAACPYLVVLASSRAPLGVYGEHEYPLAPFPVLDLQRLPSGEQLLGYDVIRLFVDRASAVQPDFALTPETGPVVAEICTRLDGLPLAIELAAARCKFLSPSAILTRLGHRLVLLTGGPRDRLARQQTLRGAIDWSYDLLSPEQQTLFRRLAVFAGSFSLEAAGAVTTEGASDVLDGLSALIDQSLLQRADEAAGWRRFRMLETMREYAQERLDASGEAASLQQRHAVQYLALAEEAESALVGPEHDVWLAHLEREHDNLRAALAWLVEGGDTGRALRLGAALGRFWLQRGYLLEGRQRLDRVLALSVPFPLQGMRAAALGRAAGLAMAQGDYAVAQTFQEEALSIQERRGDTLGIATALGTLGLLARERGDHGVARELFQRALTIQAGLNDHHGMAMSIDRLATMAHALGDPAEAEALYARSLALFREIGDRTLVAWSLHNRGYLLLDQGETATAGALFRESLRLRRELGDRPGVVRSLAALAALAGSERRQARALTLAGAASAGGEAIGLLLSRLEREQLEHWLPAARQALADAAPAWEAGRAMSLDDAITYALPDDKPAAQRPPPTVEEGTRPSCGGNGR